VKTKNSGACERLLAFPARASDQWALPVARHGAEAIVDRSG